MSGLSMEEVASGYATLADISLEEAHEKMVQGFQAMLDESQPALAALRHRFGRNFVRRISPRRAARRAHSRKLKRGR